MLSITHADTKTQIIDNGQHTPKRINAGSVIISGNPSFFLWYDIVFLLPFYYLRFNDSLIV